MNYWQASMTNPLLSPADDFQDVMRSHLMDSLRGHFAGWKAKINADFAADSYASEFESLRGDPVYRQFSFDRPEYVLIRLMGRMSISIGRRLGEIYDKLPRMAAAARFDLRMEQVVQKLSGLELDITLRSEDLRQTDRIHIDHLLASRLGVDNSSGLAIEIRYNFNPNDSSRLRKDGQLAELVKAEDLFPVYLVFSSISPRQDAIRRLSRAGWHFLIGSEATGFLDALLGVDFDMLLQNEALRKEIDAEISDMMSQIFESDAFREATKFYLRPT